MSSKTSSRHNSKLSSGRRLEEDSLQIPVEDSWRRLGKQKKFAGPKQKLSKMKRKINKDVREIDITDK